MGNYQSQFTGAQIDERLSAVPGKYVKPTAGIPSTDMTSEVQTSLGKADTALQEVPSTYRTAAAQDVIDATKASAASVTEINGKIPAQASSSNQLADKAFVNSSIQTATAEFKGTFDCSGSDNAVQLIYAPLANLSTKKEILGILGESYHATGTYTGQFYAIYENGTVNIYQGDDLILTGSGDIELTDGLDTITVSISVSGSYCRGGMSSSDANIVGGDYILDCISWNNGTFADVDNNDYAFVVVRSRSGDIIYSRYKYADDDWSWEYDLNTSGFTAAQWAAINSGATAAQIAAIAGKYTKPAAGIPESDLADAAIKVRTAVYGTTTFATMKGWLDNGDVVRCVMGDDSDMIGYVTYYSANKIHFLASSLDTGVSGEIGICVVANGQGSADVWTYDTFQPENAGDKVVSLSSASTDTQYPSAKCVYDNLTDKADKTPVSSPASASSYAIAVDTMTNLGTLTGSIALTLATEPSDDKVHIYAFTFTAGSTAPTITWPSGISWNGGAAPTITAGKSYEVSICQSKALISEF